MQTDIRITILVDNTATRPDILAEHGLSLWIEYGTKHILWDTGQSDILLVNAKTLGADLALTDVIAVSHGHYDHTGGLAATLAAAPKAKVYIHPEAMTPRYSKKNTVRQIGMPLAAVEYLNNRSVNWIRSWTQIDTGVFLSGPIPRQTAFEDTGGAFFLDPECRIHDTLPDDQAMVLESEKGLIVIAGCAHSGIVNTLDFISRKTRQNNVYMVIGGMHLGNANQERLEQTIEAFTRYSVQKIIPLHCTGINAIQYLQKALSEKIVQVPQSPHLKP